MTARLPMFFGPRMSGEEFDRLLAAGFRRTGRFAYYTACPDCRACEPTRVDLEQFSLTASLRRVLKRGDKELSVRRGPCEIEAVRLGLYDLHRRERGLDRERSAITAYEYASAFVESCCETQELSCWIDDRLLAVSITDLGHQSLSAVYCYFDPQYSSLSLGTYCILKQMQWAMETGRRYLYLGMFIEANQHVRYKGRFVPQERFIRSEWSQITTAIDWTSRERGTTETDRVMASPDEPPEAPR
jgi:arginine-tRNA-protein transferase